MNPGVFTADTGDALFWATTLIDGFVVTGGKGRFCGAAGSGAISAFVPAADKGRATITWEGMIEVPKT